MTKLLPLWIASLILVAVATFAYAQGRLAQPQTLSADDIRFRVDGTDISGRPYGQWLLRYNGSWVELGMQGTIRPAH